MPENSAGDKALKGILKKTSQFGTPSSLTPQAPLSPTSPPERNRQIALQHARIAYDKREASFRVLASIEELVDFPSSSTRDPLYPSQNDVQRLKEMLRDFQKSDYDDLIEERNINSKCGYTLCPHPNRSTSGKGRFRIVAGGTTFKVVDRKDLEKWCSDTCAEYALYLKLQMEETPAWDRRGGHQDLRLRGEAAEPDSTTEVQNLGESFDKLALERGETASASLRSDRILSSLMERDTKDAKVDPPTPSTSHSTVDGYTPLEPGNMLSRHGPTLVEMLQRTGLDDDSDAEMEI